jgi:hypothetical protein
MKEHQKRRYIRENGLSIVFFGLFLFALVGQIVTGYFEHNKELIEKEINPLSFTSYLSSGHFLQSTFENWESEFLQMGLYVFLAIYLRQKGSSESKHLEKIEEVDREPSAKRKGAPWPVRKGGWILYIYKSSLTLSFLVLFVFSFCLHLYGSIKDENQNLIFRGLPTHSVGEYILQSRFWFESFQNWQSEFLSVFAIVVFSIFLRQKGSPQSKPVDAPNDETGE